ncbi:MAG: hypothetical protein LBR10_03815 [Prevotellaceae bacterium]|nr:hypothetical protein [Prevotellaceae bacterium]
MEYILERRMAERILKRFADHETERVYKNTKRRFDEKAQRNNRRLDQGEADIIRDRKGQKDDEKVDKDNHPPRNVRSGGNF